MISHDDHILGNTAPDSLATPQFGGTGARRRVPRVHAKMGDGSGGAGVSAASAGEDSGGTHGPGTADERGTAASGGSNVAVNGKDLGAVSPLHSGALLTEMKQMVASQAEVHRKLDAQAARSCTIL